MLGVERAAKFVEINKLLGFFIVVSRRRQCRRGIRLASRLATSNAPWQCSAQRCSNACREIVINYVLNASCQLPLDKNDKYRKHFWPERTVSSRCNANRNRLGQYPCVQSLSVGQYGMLRHLSPRFEHFWTPYRMIRYDIQIFVITLDQIPIDISELREQSNRNGKVRPWIWFLSFSVVFLSWVPAMIAREKKIPVWQLTFNRIGLKFIWTWGREFILERMHWFSPFTKLTYDIRMYTTDITSDTPLHAQPSSSSFRHFAFFFFLFHPDTWKPKCYTEWVLKWQQNWR